MSVRKFLRRFSSERSVQNDVKAPSGSVAGSRDQNGHITTSTASKRDTSSGIPAGLASAKSGISDSRRDLEGSGGLTARDAAAIDASWQSSKLEDHLDTAADEIENVEKKIQQSTVVLAGKGIKPIITAALDVTGGTKLLEGDMTAFEEAMPLFMKALDAAKAVHPFIGVVVLAFQAVYSLEMTRRDNDKKIIALYGEMKSMMAVLIDLKDLRDVDKTAPDGTSIRGRMVTLCEKTALDVKMCSHTCDTYRRKRDLVKVLQGPVWDQRLASFVATFTTRRSEFQFALSIHTAQGVENANKTLSNVEKVAEEANERTKLILAAFEKLLSPEELNLKKLASKQGKDLEAIKQDDSALLALLGGQPDGGKLDDAKKAAAVSDLKEDLSESIDESLDKNYEAFSGKFDLQQRQIVQYIKRINQREGDRVIAAVAAGPVDKILDPDLHKMWRDMGWRGSVKTRHFILALREYFLDKKKNRDNDVGNVTSKTALAFVTEEDDDWALKYLDFEYLQGIQEAFDTDASGFITISEVNKFTRNRPLGWSLLKWMAYWACGFFNTMSTHSERIEDIFHDMFSLVPLLRLENQAQAAGYLEHVWQNVATVTNSLSVSIYLPKMIRKKFADYGKSEMDRMRQYLEDIRYDIDEMATVTLLLDHDRVERSFLPLTRLLLARHLQIFHLARTYVLNPEELADARGTMSLLYKAVKMRFENLKDMYLLRNSDYYAMILPESADFFSHGHQTMSLDERFKIYAFGFFEGLSNPQKLWSTRAVQSQWMVDIPYTEGEQPKNPDNNVLNYDLGTPILLDLTGYELSNAPEEPANAPRTDLPSEFLALLGAWNCLTYHSKEWERATEPISTVTFRHSDDDPKLSFLADGTDYTGQEYHIRGQAAVLDGGPLDLTWRTTYRDTIPGKLSTGRFDPASGTISGSWKLDAEGDNTDGCFFYSRTPCEVLIYRPAFWAVPPANKAKALWNFACNAVLHDVRKRLWSWSYFDERRKIRLTFVRSCVNRDSSKQTYPAHEVDEGQVQAQSQLMPSDARYYFSRIRQFISLRIHGELRCVACNGSIGFERIICLDCKFDEAALHKPVNFCNNPGCTTIHIPFFTDLGLAQPHLASHDCIKIRRLVTLRDVGLVYIYANEAVLKAKEFTRGGDPTSSAEESPVAVETLSNDLTVITTFPTQLPSVNAAYDVEKPTDAVADRDQGSAASWPIASTTQGDVDVSNKDRKSCHVICLACQGPLASCWWYCVDCSRFDVNVFLCEDCDPMGGYQPTDDSHIHRRTHTLVTCKERNSDDEDAEPQTASDIMAVKGEVQAISSRLDNLETMMAKLLDQMQELAKSRQ